MQTYYVATLARYALVEARDQDHARLLGHDALYELYADVRERMGREVPINIQIVRPATAEEISLWDYHHERVAAEKRWRESNGK